MDNHTSGREHVEDRVRAEVGRHRTRQQLVRTAQRVLSAEDSEDAAHDAVVHALLHAQQFRADAQVGTWLYRIAFNAALVRQRCDQRTSLRLRRVQLEADAGVVPIAVTPSITGEIEQGELRARLRAAVNDLPAVYRTAVERCIYDEESPDSVAAALGITSSALRTRITRAREQLRALLGTTSLFPRAAFGQ
jgi:RNA polymerase sigma-70 factor (ECF subfamily)